MSRFIQDLFTAAMGGGTIRRYGDMALVMLPGTALVTTRQNIQHAQRWARALDTSGEPQNDRQRLVDQLETRIARIDQDNTTRGAPDALMQLAVRMRDNNMDLDSWHIPRPVIDALPARKPATEET